MKNLKRISIIPEPKVIEYGPESFDLTRTLSIGYFCSKRLETECKRITTYLRHALRSGKNPVRVRQENKRSSQSPRTLFIYIRQANTPFSNERCLQYKEKISHKQGYSLHVAGKAVVCQANTCEGLFYAVQTLLQLMQDRKTEIPGCHIRDWPDIERRYAHIDFGHLVPTIDTIKQRLVFFSELKINGVIFTYGNKFKFEKHPKVSHASALDKAAVSEIVAFAKERYIDVVPVIQAFGHSANVLVNDEYAHLREGNNNITQFCPMHPGTLTLFKEMAEEVLAVHDSPYFHIGADETYFLGSCEKCRRVVKRKGKIGLYIDYVTKACEFVRSKGRIPMVWDDMLCQSPGDIRRFDKDAIVCYWDYFPNDDRNPFVFFRNDGWYCDMQYWREKKWWGGDFINSGRCKDIKSLDKRKFQHYQKYFFESKNHRYFSPFPFHRFYQDKGFTTLGCSAVRGGEYGCVTPHYDKRLSNILKMIDTVVRNEGKWVLTTSWSEMLAAEETCFYLFAALGEYSWSHQGTTLFHFNEKFSRYAFGVEDPLLIDALFLLGQFEPPLCYTSEDRSDICERGMYADAESFKELVDNRIKKLVALSDSKFQAERVKLGEITNNARKALEIVTLQKKRIRRGRAIVDHIGHGAQVLLHKVGQAELFLEMECLLKKKNPGSSQSLRDASKRLAQLEKDLKVLRQKDRRLFGRTCTPDGVQDRAAKVFQGELEKIFEYKDRIVRCLHKSRNRGNKKR